jgi:hypothetical protein
VARIKVTDAKTPPEIIEAQPFQAEIWTWIFPGHEKDPVVHDTGGEYVPVTFLRDGSLGVCEEGLGFGTAKAAIASRAAMVHGSTL